MNNQLEEMALERQYSNHNQSLELAPTAAAAMAQYEIQSAIIISQKCPRNEENAFAALMRSCKRTAFALKASYSFPRGKKKDAQGNWVPNNVEGPSVNLAREAARVWGNIRYGIEVIREDMDSRQIRGWAWDLQTNVKVSADDDFRKLIMKKRYVNGREDGVDWIPADERELRELTNRRGAILVRNCILQLLPPDLISDARQLCSKTAMSGLVLDPDGEKKKIILGFAEINVTPEMLEQMIGHKIAQCAPFEIAELRKVFESIRDGQSTWSDYADKAEEPEKPTDEPLKPTDATTAQTGTDAAAATTQAKTEPTATGNKSAAKFGDSEADPFKTGELHK